MNKILNQITEHIDNYVEIEFNIKVNLNEQKDLLLFKKNFNKSIKEKIPEKKAGVYIWEVPSKEEIIYIGMAGKIDRNGNLKNHYLHQRLKASRGKNELGIDVSNGELFFKLLTNPKKLKMKKFQHLNKPFDSINIHVFCIKDFIPATYIESILLNKYFNIHSKLPTLNLSF